MIGALPWCQGQGQEAAVAKRQISLWTEREKGAFVDAYKALSLTQPLNVPHLQPFSV